MMTNARAQGTSAVLHWARNTETDVAGYNIFLFTPSPGSDDSYTKVNTTLVPGTWYTVTDLTVGTMYYFKVSAVDWSGNESAASVPASVYVIAAERDNGEGRLGEFQK
jgi:hypothetical protein